MFGRCFQAVAVHVSSIELQTAAPSTETRRTEDSNFLRLALGVPSTVRGLRTSFVEGLGVATSAPVGDSAGGLCGAGRTPSTKCVGLLRLNFANLTISLVLACASRTREQLAISPLPTRPSTAREKLSWGTCQHYWEPPLTAEFYHTDIECFRHQKDGYQF